MSRHLERQPKVWAQVAYYTSLGFILPACTVAGYILGWLLDRWLHTAPIMAVVTGFLGAVGGFLEVLSLLKRAEKRMNGSDAGSRSGSG